MDSLFAAAASCALMIVVLAVFAVALLRPSRREEVELEGLRAELAELRREQSGRVGS